MYAVIETGGRQYRVSEGETIKLEKIKAEGTFEFDKVLMVSDGSKVIFGSPFVPSAKVSAEVLGEGKAKKVLVFKQKPRKGYRKLRGHRQPYMTVKIKNIVLA